MKDLPLANIGYLGPNAPRLLCSRLRKSSGDDSSGHCNLGRDRCNLIGKLALPQEPAIWKLQFVHLDPPGLIRSWKIREFGEHLSSGGFHHGSFDDDAGSHIFPERDQQLARQRHDGRLLETAAIAADPVLEPQSQRRLRLIAQP